MGVKSEFARRKLKKILKKEQKKLKKRLKKDCQTKKIDVQ